MRTLVQDRVQLVVVRVITLFLGGLWKWMIANSAE